MAWISSTNCGSRRRGRFLLHFLHFHHTYTLKELRGRMCLNAQSNSVGLSLVVLLVEVVVLLMTTLPFVGGHCFARRDTQTHETIQFAKHEGKGDGSFYYYSSISSPGFPSEFETPYSKFYYINATYLPGLENKDPVVNIYPTELFMGWRHLNIFDGWNRYREVNWDTRLVQIILGPGQVIEIQVCVLNLFDHLRTRGHFHSSFGYNLTLEVRNWEQTMASSPVDRKRGCSLRNCSFAGECKSFPGTKGLEFRCECLEGYSGPYCQYGPECDPSRNITFCQNGGTCSSFGDWGGRCECPYGYYGSKCQFRKARLNFVAKNKDCVISNTFYNSTQVSMKGIERPCSLCNTFSVQSNTTTTESQLHRYFFRLDMDMDRGEWNSWNVSDLFNTLFDHHAIGFQLSVGERHYVEVYGTPWDPKQQSQSLPPGLTLTLLGNGSALNSSDYFKLQPIILNNKEDEKPLTEGVQFSLTCKSRLSPSASSDPRHLMQFRWFKDHVPIRQEYSLRHISHFETVPDNGSEIWSILIVDSVSPFDMGIFTCQVTDVVRNVQECVEYAIPVVVPPQIEVMPMSVTMAKNESRVLICSDGLEALSSGSHDSFNITWLKDQKRLVNRYKFSMETVYPQGRLLRIKNIRESATFTCKAANKGGGGERSVRVEVLDENASPYEYCSPTCEIVETTGGKVVWARTAIGQTAMMKCPGNFSGFAQKLCTRSTITGQGSWNSTDFSRCTHKQLGRFNYTLRSMQHGYNIGGSGLHILSSDLNSYLDGRKQNASSPHNRLLYGEGDKFGLMLEDTMDYLHQLTVHSPQLVMEEHILGMITVLENFIGFRNSCSHESAVNKLLKHFLQFIKEFNITKFAGERVFIERISLNSSFSLAEENDEVLSNSVEIDGSSSRLILDCDAISENNKEEEEGGRLVTFTVLSEFSNLHNNASFLSDIVSVDISSVTDPSCVKDGVLFEIQFDLKKPYSYGNKSCVGFYGSTWRLNACTINSTYFVASCLCKLPLPQAYAVIMLEEEERFEPQASEFIDLPPDWIATSGAFVCLVLCLKTLVCGLMRRSYKSYFLVMSVGMIVSSFCLLLIILTYDSREVCLLFMLTTLTMQCARVWEMARLSGLIDMYPWLTEVSKWTILSAITLTEILPFLTVYIVESVYLNHPSLLVQNSVVFVAFAILFAISVLAIFIAYYKTYLRIHRKSASNNNNSSGERNTLNETFCHTVLHMVHLLCIVLFYNLRRHIFFHYLVAISSIVVGLAWPSPKRRNLSSSVNNDKPRNDMDGVVVNGVRPSAMRGGGGPNSNAMTKLLELKPLKESMTLEPGQPSAISIIPPPKKSVSFEEHHHHHHDDFLDFPSPPPPPLLLLPPIASGEEEDDSLLSKEHSLNTLSTSINVSTISNNVNHHRDIVCLSNNQTVSYPHQNQPYGTYSGVAPDRGQCHLRLDDSHYLINDKSQSPSKLQPADQVMA